jgi:GTP cyclohydrolase I
MRKHFATCEKKKQAESHEASVDAFLRAAGDDPAKFKIKPIPRRR